MAKKSLPSKYPGLNVCGKKLRCTAKEKPWQSHRKSLNALRGSSCNLALAVLVSPFSGSLHSIGIPDVTWEDDSASGVGSGYYSFLFARREDGRV